MVSKIFPTVSQNAVDVRCIATTKNTPKTSIYDHLGIWNKILVIWLNQLSHMVSIYIA